MCTRFAVCARNTAAWPAELPPPTTIDFFTAAQLRLHECRAVVHARAFELRQVLEGGFRYAAPVAMMTVRADTCASSSISMAYGFRSQTRLVAPFAIITWAPNFCACVYARPASS